MTVDLIYVTVGILGLAVAAWVVPLRRLPVTPPLLALAAGALLAAVGLVDLPDVTEDPAFLHEPSRALLAISVMAVALRFPFRTTRGRGREVALLLLVAMPAMAVVSAVLGWWLLGLPVATAALLGAAVAPTDPVLASSVVVGEEAERDLPSRDRELLSLESGANDGLALPLVVAALAAAGSLTTGEAAVEMLWQVLGATVVGIVAGVAGAAALTVAERRGDTASGPSLLLTVVLALATLGVAGLVHTDGVLAVFVAGLAFAATSHAEDRAREVSMDEALNTFVVLPLFVLLGTMLPWQAWRDLGWGGALLVVAVLAVRRLPVVLALARPLRLRRRDAVYLGWFGPIGVSALFYLTLEAERTDVPVEVLAAGTLLIAASTLVHGVSATPGRRLYAARDRRT